MLVVLLSTYRYLFLVFNEYSQNVWIILYFSLLFSSVFSSTLSSSSPLKKFLTLNLTLSIIPPFFISLSEYNSTLPRSSPSR